MFSFLKPDPLKKLHKQYEEKLEKALVAHRSGDVKTYSFLTVEAEQIYNQIQELENKSD